MKNAWFFLFGAVLMLAISSCDPAPTEYQDPWGAERWGLVWHCPDSLGYDGFMQKPLELKVSPTAVIQMSDELSGLITSQLSGFFEAINASDYKTSFGDYMIPESYPSDSIRDQTISMSYRWDSIGVANHTNDVTINYLSPLIPGPHYDLAFVDFEMTQTMYFASDRNGNFRNNIRVLERRYPGIEVDITDSSWVNKQGREMRRRALAVTVNSSLYAATKGDGQVYWMVPGSEHLPTVWEVMDTLQLDALREVRQLNSPVATHFE
jgi:hypothetical protein